MSDGYVKREEEDAFEEDELDENNYKTQKDALLLAININSTMLQPPPPPPSSLDAKGKKSKKSKDVDRDSAAMAALKCAYHLMQQRIISNPRDMMGILLYGTQKSYFQEDTEGGDARTSLAYPHCYLLTDLDIPAAEDVKAIKALAEDGEDEDQILEATDETVAMANVLFCANQIFTTKAANFGSRRLFIITDDDDPHAIDKQAKSAAAVRAKDLFDLGVQIELFPITRGVDKFDLGKFYDDIVYRDPTVEANLSEVRSSKSGDGLSLLNSLISNINSKQSAKRSLFSNITFEIAPNLSISVNGYNVLNRQKPERSCYIWLDGEKPQLATSETTKTSDDGDRTVQKAEIKKAYKFGGDYIYFTPEEQKSLRNFGGPVIRIIGFKPRSLIPHWASVKKSLYIFPSEVNYIGSTRVFSALWQKLLKDDKVGLAWCVTRANAAPRLVAIIPSREQSDEESGTPYLPGGLWLYTLPFVDDLRSLPEREKSHEDASPELVNKMRIIIQQLQLPKAMFNPIKYPNPSLQWHYKILQALALEEEVPEKPEDSTEPKYSAIGRRAGAYIEEWDQLLKEESNSAANAASIKREAAADPDDRPAKRSRTVPIKIEGGVISDADLKLAVQTDAIKKMTVVQLKDACGPRGLSTTGKKADLIDKLTEWAEMN